VSTFDINDPDVQRYIKMAIATQIATPQPPRKQPGGLLGFLWGLFLLAMTVTFAILVAPHAVSLFLWYQEGIPIADAPARPTVVIATSIPSRPIIVPPRPAEQPVIVVPQGPPNIPPTPEPLPTPLPPAVQQEYAAAYALAVNTPTPGTWGAPECNAQNATYRSDTIRVTTPDGMPIGEVSAWSCTSAEAAAQEAQQRAVETLNTYLAAHPEVKQ
jgi:hypothetical protein